MRLLERNPAPVFHAEIVTCFEHFVALQAEWDVMIKASGISHPFMSHLWLRTWWECFGDHHDLRVILVRQDTRLVAAAPMLLRRTSIYGVPLTSLETLCNAHTPRVEFPVCGPPERIYPLIWREISAQPCDVIVLKQFLDGSPSLDAMQVAAISDGWAVGGWDSSTSLYIPLEADHPQVLKRLKSKHRNRLRKRYRDLSNTGEVSLEMLDRPEDLEEGLREGLQLEAAAWKGEAGTAIISDPAVARFYSALAWRAAERGWLKLAFLCLDGQRISFDYILETAGTIYGMKIGYDPAFRQYSPGHTLLNLVLRDACDRKLREYDFVGDDDEWKYMWTDSKRKHRWLFMYRSHWKGKLLHALKFAAAPRMRRLLHSLRSRAAP